MAGGFHTPRQSQRNTTLAQRLQAQAQDQDKPGECWIIPDHGQPIRGTILERNQTPDGNWIYTLTITKQDG